MQTAIQIVQPPTGQVQTVSVASPAVEQVPAFCVCIPYECRVIVLMVQSMNRFFYFAFLLTFSLLMCTFGRVASLIEFCQCVLLV